MEEEQFTEHDILIASMEKNKKTTKESTDRVEFIYRSVQEGSLSYISWEGLQSHWMSILWCWILSKFMSNLFWAILPCLYELRWFDSKRICSKYYLCLMVGTAINWTGARGVMVIVAGIGHGDTSSNPGLIAFHIALIPLGKVRIQLFSLQLWVNSRADLVLQPWWGN